MKYKQKIKYIGIVVFGIVLAMLFHVLTSKYSTTPKTANWSFLVKNFGLMQVIIVWYFIAYGAIVCIFYRYKDKFAVPIRNKGLGYGIAIGILWLWGMLEGVLLFGNPFINEFLTGVCDAVPIIIMGILLEKATNKDGEEAKGHIQIKSIIISVVIFSIIFLVERYFLSITRIIKSSYDIKPYFNFIWTLIMGSCIGISYSLIGKATKGLSGIKFAIVIFGINWLVFNIFMPFLFSAYIHEFIIRNIADILGVMLSIYLSERLNKIDSK